MIWWVIYSFTQILVKIFYDHKNDTLPYLYDWPCILMFIISKLKITKKNGVINI